MTDPEQDAIRHGHCPTCGRPLTPIPGAPGTTGRCPQDGLWCNYLPETRRMVRTEPGDLGPDDDKWNQP